MSGERMTGRRRFLVVEDHRETRTFIVETIRKAFGDATVTEVGSYDRARALLFSRESRLDFDIALIDIALPDGSGIDLISAINASRPDIMPVVITIYDDDHTLFEALAAGAQGYLLKAVKTESFIDQLRRIDADEPPISPPIARRMLAHFKRPEEQVRAVEAPGILLTNRENEVLRYLGKGFTTPEIAELLGVSHHTCATHIKSIYRKLNVSSRAEAAVEADRRGLI